jgi:hypothetical protein
MGKREARTFLKAAVELTTPGGYIMFVENGLVVNEEPIDHT